ncbi:MAG: YggS family pyridoxal phosphate-dependent enzyme [Alphaproteobacteria bacterium]|nr:YggS family pyridoxal phosphate-dependent enzyme [Alphaproteobacteria bacterium]
MSDSICENILRINKEIETISQEFSVPKLPKLIAVSKNQDVSKIEQAILCGQTDFAENYIQEAEEKWLPLKNKYPHVCLHLIGNLQKNKVKKALHLFDCIHTLDSISLANRIAKLMEEDGLTNKTFLIQVLLDKNSSTKYGLPIEELPSLINESNKLNLNIIGLMGVAPIDSPATAFLNMQNLAQENNLPELSMGMSGDYETAIKYGSTMLRLGTAIFGKRES